MKRTPKWVFFVVALFIVALTVTSVFGVYKQYGDRRDTIIRGAADIRFGIDIRGGVDVTFGPEDENINADEDQVNAIKAIIEQRLVGQNITDYECYADVNNQQVIVRFPWQSDEADYDASKAIEELGQTAELAFYIGTEKTGEPVLTGDGVSKAEAVWQTDDSGQSEPVVRLTLQGDAVQAFADATQQQLATNGQISIWLDETMISAPQVQAHITDGVAVISGGTLGTFTDAQQLANNINAGALPFAIKATSFATLSPTLGEQALNVMVIAGIIAFVLVAVYVILWYRLPGVVAVIALMGQVSGSLAAISGYFGVFDSFTLTLPGIAGIILSIGIGVDANVITAERVREEIRRGKTIDGAIRAGSKNSFWAIFDGNITVLIVAVVLMGVFGPPSSFWATVLSWALFMFPASTTGMVYSFGYTLFVGVVLNFVMGIALSRLMLRSVSRFKIFRNPWLYGGERK